MSEVFQCPPSLRKWGLRNIGQRPAARQMVAGIAKAGRDGRVRAWQGNLRDRDLEPVEQTDGGFLTCCPAHNDHNPSFVATDGVDKLGQPRLLVYCRSGCSQDQLIQTLDELGLWDCTPEMIDRLDEAVIDATATEAKKKSVRTNSVAIVPIPADSPMPPNQHYDLGPVAKSWAYRNAAGELVFYVCRFDPNPTWKRNFAQAPKERKVEKPIGKIFRPLSYRKFEDGTVRWAWVAPASDVIPLYNADNLAGSPTAKVIVCEGEKAADAAQALFTDHIVVTWYSGAKAVTKAPWKTLTKRDVLIWPDHDEAGSGAAQAIINELRLVGCESISVVDVKALAAIDPQDPDGAKREPPQKWDAANASSEWADHIRLRMEVDRNSQRLEARVQVELSPDNIGETVDKAEDVLKNSRLPIFKRAGFIVRVGQYLEKCADGRSQHVLVAESLNTAGLGEALESVIRFEQYDARKKKMKPVHASDLLLKTFLERGRLSGLDALTGVTDIPLVRRDGSLLDAPGYDEATGIYYRPSELALNIPEDGLTLDDAKEAIETLKRLIRDFPFESDVDRAAAISAFVSAVNRPTLGATPMHALTSPTPGTGKSLLATLVTIVSTGSLPSFITQGQTDEELEKRLSTQMLEGRQVINLDNCNLPLKGAALSNLLTAERVSLRILGLSKMPEITSSSFILVNGNNVRLADDMVRRAVISRIDPGMERPEERAIDWDAKVEARRNRGKYVSACMIIMLAYRAAGAPKQTTPLGSFEDWSRRVRDALVWAGLPDPCGNAHKLRDADPERERFLDVAQQWDKYFGDTWMKVADVIAQATPQTSIQNSELRVALVSVAGASRDISPNRLAAFLSRYARRPIEGFKFVSRRGHAGTKLWRLEKSGTVNPQSTPSSEDSHT